MRFTTLLTSFYLIATALFQTASAAQDIRIEAENGELSGFTVMGTYPFFSNGEAIQAPSDPGHTATYTFPGATGIYDVTVGYCDEDDGTSSHTLSGSAVGPITSWQGDQPTGEIWCNSTSLLTRVIATSTTLQQGETLILDCQRDQDEPCRVDYFDFTYVDPVPASEHTVEFVAVEDAYVSADFPDTNYGAAATLNATAIPEEVSYLKFNVSLPPGATVSEVKLHLHTTTAEHQSGVQLYETETSWSEASLTYSSRPASGGQVGAIEGWSTPGWKETTLSTLARHSGTWGIAVHPWMWSQSPSVPTVPSVFDSREATNRPKLTVTYTVSGADPAPDCIGEPADHPVVAYGQPRVFLEAQGWWGERLPDGSIPKFGDAEHLHIGACFPVQQTVSGTIRLDFRVVAHNAPLDSVIESTRFHDFDFDGSGSTVYEFDWNITVDEVDEIGWHTLYVDTTEWPDGLREARPFTTLIRPNGAEIHTSASWCWDVQNGQPDSDAPLCDREVIQGRGWYDCFEYKKAETAFWEYPYEGVTAGTDHFLRISGADGAPSGGEIAPQHYFRLNPGFHANQGGLHLLTHDGEHYNEPLTINGSMLTPGVHVVFVMTDDEGLCEEISPDTGFPEQIVPQDGEISGGIRVPILVQP